MSEPASKGVGHGDNRNETALIFKVDGPVAWLTFNRPQARNAMTWDMYDGLIATCERVASDNSIRVLMMRGSGNEAFVSGTDIHQFDSLRTPADALAYEARIERVIGSLETLCKPTIALIRGYAVGAGLAIALACDLRLATADVQFGVPVARTLGNCLSTANYARLLDAIGPARTKELIFTARLIGAEEGHDLGLFNEIVPPAELETRGRELAIQISQHAPLTIWATKEALRRLYKHRRGPKDLGRDLIVTTYTSDDFREGVRAFSEKRHPHWRGR